MQKTAPRQQRRPRSRPGLGAIHRLTAIALFAAGCAASLGDSKPIPGTEEPYPNLASVPPRREPYTTPAERRELEEQLTLERAAARSTGEGQAAAVVPGTVMVNGATLPAEAISAATATDGAWLNPNVRQAGANDLVALIFFANGSSALSGKAMDVLRGVAAVQRERGGVVRLVGHASASTGVADMGEAARINRAMSLARAEAAARLLRRLGLSQDQIEVEGAGATAPAFDEKSTTGAAGNRRVEVYLRY